MSVMRRIAIPIVALLANLHAASSLQAASPVAMEDIRVLAQAGAVRLALQRIETLQPADAADPRWTDWEDLRLQLLGRLDRHEEILQRAAVMPASLPAAARADFHAAAARAAIALGRAVPARDHAGRALWASGTGPATVRELRLLVIRSHFLDSRPDDAWRSMLRFEQDYRPLDAATAGGFVDALLDAGMAREAITWLPLLDERGATRLRLRMHAGLVANGEALAQARAALARGDDPAWWRLLLDAATRGGDGALRIAALEQLLEKEARPQAAAELWSAYAGHARAAANSHHLLAGDYASWLEFAARRHASDAPEARAYFAYVARHAADPALRQRAQDRLAADYAVAKLPRLALSLFDAWPGRAEQLPPPARLVLGRMAEDMGDHPRALRYLQDLPALDPMPAAVWQLRLSALALRAGKPDAAAGIAQRLAAESSAISPAQIAEWLQLAGQLADHGLHDAALALLERLLPHTDSAQSPSVLSAIARAHAGRKQPQLAADFYLRAALQVPATGAAAAEARLQAGLSLARAGLHEDARAQFQWLLKNAADPAQIAVARRELGF
ncbi:MAG: hypothetical protein KF771_00515 [Burkholderiales bacterium]|nr:hypothetical protein [Burkholderiales bacterium]